MIGLDKSFIFYVRAEDSHKIRNICEKTRSANTSKGVVSPYFPALALA